jgi:hypothetical protein
MHYSAQRSLPFFAVMVRHQLLVVPEVLPSLPSFNHLCAVSIFFFFFVVILNGTQVYIVRCLCTVTPEI